MNVQKSHRLKDIQERTLRDMLLNSSDWEVKSLYNICLNEVNKRGLL